MKQVALLISLIIAAVVISLVCYVLYYRLEGRAGYIDGIIPLITETVVMVVFLFVMAVMP